MNALSAGADGVVHDYVRRGSRTQRRGACASSATRKSASPRIISASCASFASTPAYGHGLPDAAGLAACIAARAGLGQLSRERVRMELLKLLLARHATPALAADGGIRSAGAGAGRRARSRGLREHGQGRGGGRRAGRHRAAARRARPRIAEDAERLWQRLRLSNVEHERIGVDGRIVVADFAGRREGRPRAALSARPGAFRRSRAARLGALARDRARSGLARARHAARALDRAGVSAQGPTDFIKRGVPPGPALGAALHEAEAAGSRRIFRPIRRPLPPLRPPAVAEVRPM
jgi:poly(A) polymerase